MSIEPKKKGIIGWIKNKTEEKPVTMEQIEQLKLKTIKKRLEADMAESEAIKQRARVERSRRTLNALFGSMEESEEQRKDQKERDELRRKTLGF